MAVVTATAALYPVTTQHWIWLGLLVLASTVHLEAARGMERLREIAAEGAPYNHLQTVWFFAAILLLPPPLICLLFVVSYIYNWFRVYRRRALVHRKIFSAATVVLASAAAYAVLAAVYPTHSEPFATALDSPRGLAAVVAAGALYRLVNYGLVVFVIVATNPDQPPRMALGHASDQLMIAGAIGLGGGIAVMVAAHPWWTPLLVVTVFSLHTGLLMPQFRDASRSDAKTGLFDSVFWAKLVSDEMDRARRLDGTLGVLLLDLDHFKRVNDRYGHLAGDAVLRAVADAIKHSVRGHDMVGRYGGEEFSVVMPGLDAADVTVTAERIRAAVASLKVTTTDLDGVERVISGLTASVGAAIFPGHGEDRTTVLLAADAALYEAKAAGRDRTRVAGTAPRDGTASNVVPLPKQSAGPQQGTVRPFPTARVPQD
ncbi:GGDEF domain-containing protein [Actinophytocola sp.]|uniref:GGDEF domain-containing protein n=1 Tax=Actinophytocola sp. TaxID=1872138 RepID=UPI002ED9493B